MEYQRILNNRVAKRIINYIKNREWGFLLWIKSSIIFYERTGELMNYCHPKNINEKLMWLTRFWQDPLKTYCADKYLVRSYVSSKGLSHILVPLINVYEKASDINFDELPKGFVLKCNHGSGFNIICLDKDQADYNRIVIQLNEWMNLDFARYFYEIQYSRIERKIVCEKLLCTDKAPTEYQLWCINGKPDSFLVCRKNYDGTYDSGSYSLDWEHLCERMGESSVDTFPKPLFMNEMIKYAELLSEPFPFVRVDFYEVNNAVYFAELTFTPSANVLSNYKEVFLERLGNKMELPPKKGKKIGELGYFFNTTRL